MNNSDFRRNGILSRAKKKVAHFLLDSEELSLQHCGKMSKKTFPSDMGARSDQSASELKDIKLTDDLKDLFVGSIKALSSAVDAKSPWTAGHSERVASYAYVLGNYIGLGKSMLYDLEIASILHDVGKIGVCGSILDKPDKLTNSEYEIVKSHPGIGGEVIAHIKKLQHLIPIIRAHHECYDGSGYPDKLKGKDIPLLGRVLCVVDTYDAMRADRPYRNGRKTDYILREFKHCAGSQFDPHIAGAFMDILSNYQLHADLLVDTPKAKILGTCEKLLSLNLHQ